MESTVGAETPVPATSSTEPGVVSLSAPPPRHGLVRRWRWVLPALLLLVWFGVAGMGGSFKLSEVQENDASGYLPADVESIRVSALARGFAASQTYPAFFLVTSEDQLDPQRLAQVQEFAQAIPSLPVPVKGHPAAHVSDFLAPGPIQVLPSQDGRAALAVLGFDVKLIGTTLADGESSLQKSIEAIREADQKLDRPGVQVYVTGPAGTVADLVKAFQGIDGVLLAVALGAVAVILLIVYRSPVVPLLVLMSAGCAYVLSTIVVYLLAKNDVITLDGQAQGILSILVIGAATDYALLLVARYREELRRHDDRYEAMWLAWRRTLEPVAASAGTVILGLMCLLLSQLGPTKSLGPVGAIGIASALLASLTFLPAALVIPGRNSPGEHGRWVFWPGIPHVGTEKPETAGLWGRVARMVGGSSRRVWVVTAVCLLGLAAFVPTLKAQGVTQAQTFLTTVESVTGAEQLGRHFPGGSGNPAVIIGPVDKADSLLATVRSAPGIDKAVLTTGDVAPSGMSATQAAAPPKVVDGRVEIKATLSAPADSDAAVKTVRTLRSSLDPVTTEALVGGTTATDIDLRDAASSDRNRIIPIILLVIFVVLAVLLRAVVAPLVLLLANVLSFAATLGVSALVFNHVFHFPGADAGVPLYGFVFLVALGIDYSIFLMVRVREESAIQGTRPGILTGLAVTGGVITSAGVVLAATFAALGVLPILFLAQTAFIVAFGVLLDTLVVRSLLVPALSYDIGRRIWFPGRLARAEQPESTP